MSAMTMQGMARVRLMMARVESRFQRRKTPFLFHVARRAEFVAEASLHTNSHVDTGALLASTQTTILNDSPHISQVEVRSGRMDISRGAGRYVMSSKTGKRASVLPTSQYAAVVDHRYGYMKDAFNWTASNLPKLLHVFVMSLIRRI